MTTESLTFGDVRELRDAQLAAYRSGAHANADDLDYSFAAICGRESIVGLFTGKRITREEGIARCVELLNSRAKESK